MIEIDDCTFMKNIMSGQDDIFGMNMLYGRTKGGTMKKIVIIGANSFQNRLILKAKEMGYETHVFAWKCGDIGEKTADYFYPISIIEKEEILKICREIHPQAVASIASDLAVLTVNYLARNLGLTANSEKSDRFSTNKFEMRVAMKQAGLSVPMFFKVTSKSDVEKIQDFSKAWIVKPTDRSGSRGICKVMSKDELDVSIPLAIEQSFEKAAIIEEFIDGKEYSAETISYNGVHHLLAVTEKFTTGFPHFIEIGHIQPASMSEEQKIELEKTIFAALDALDIRYGAAHVEFKLQDNNSVRIIEVGARMGGDCIGSDLVYMSTGNDFVKMVIDIAFGKRPEVLECTEPKAVAVRFIIKKDDLQLLEGNEYVNVTARRDICENFDHEVVDSSTRFGYFLATGHSVNDLKKFLFDDSV